MGCPLTERKVVRDSDFMIKLRKFITIGLLAVASLLFQPTSAKAIGGCTLSVTATTPPPGGPPFLGWITRGTTTIYWTDFTKPISVQDGDIIFLTYPTYDSSIAPWDCMVGMAYDPLTNELFFCSAVMPAYEWGGYWRVTANCQTDTFSLDWVYPGKGGGR